MRDMRPAKLVADRMALAILAAVAITAAITFRDYGLGWDDYSSHRKLKRKSPAQGRAFTNIRCIRYRRCVDYRMT